MSGRKGFMASLASGKTGENLIKRLLESAGYSVHQKTGEFAAYDLSIEPLGVTLEVKYDDKSHFTGNLAFELYNTKSNKFSGVLGTRATFWVHVLPDKSVWLSHSETLRNILDKVVLAWYDGFITFGGDDNSLMLIIKKDTILPYFTRIDGLEPADVKRIFESGEL